MSHFLEALRAVTVPILLPGAVVCVAAFLVTRRAERRRNQRRLDARRTVYGPRHEYGLLPPSERQERANHIAATTRAAFEDTLAGRPHLAAIRARQEAADFDPEAVDWTERTGR